jgi:hypothetical protein
LWVKCATSAEYYETDISVVLAVMSGQGSSIGSGMVGLQVVTRMMVMIILMVTVSGILSVWKGYFWVNNLG